MQIDYISSIVHLRVYLKQKWSEKLKINNRENFFRFIWLRLCIKNQWDEKVEDSLQFVTEVGRMKYVRPIYRDLYDWPEMRQRAIDNYNRTKDKMMYVTAKMVAKDLHLVD